MEVFLKRKERRNTLNLLMPIRSKKLNILNKSAFTLVELLVVIAIVGLLSTIVLVSTSGLSSQASVTKTLAWARSINSALGAEAVGIWNFDEGIENTCPDGKDACDISGWNNHGIMYNFVSPQGYVDTTPSGHGSALSFDGVDDYINLGNATSITTPDILTVEGWIKTTNTGSSVMFGMSGIGFGPWSSDRLIIYADIGIAHNTRNFNAPASLRDNKWHHLVFILPGKSQTAINDSKAYVDGIEMSVYSTVATGPQSSRTACDIGGKTGSFYFTGSIDEVRAYSAALTSSQIKSQYYTGLDRLLTKGFIDEQEYRERLALK
jgi:prepilin-type N-terminal cleavage/methylation domain-containing protein